MISPFFLSLTLSFFLPFSLPLPLCSEITSISARTRGGLGVSFQGNNWLSIDKFFTFLKGIVSNASEIASRNLEERLNSDDAEEDNVNEDGDEAGFGNEEEDDDFPEEPLEDD